MITTTTTFDGIRFVVPAEGFQWPHPTFAGFPTYCGAGDTGDRFIPDTIWGVSISPACFIHDQMWTLAEASWADFHMSNAILFVNLAAIIQARSANWVTRDIRLARAATYLLAVSTAGAPIFWGMKTGNKQG